MHQFIEALHRAPKQCVIAVTGGGTGAAALLLNVPGGSRSVLEVRVPYGESSLVEFLGYRPEHFCTVATSRDMAARAYERAGWLAPGEPVVGLACTASLATDRPKKGDHRFHISFQNASGVSTHSVNLSKGARDREAEESLLDTVLLNALAAAVGVNDRLPLTLLPGEKIEIEGLPAVDPLSRLFQGETTHVCVDVDGRLSIQIARPTLLVPGAFNPVHEGHRGLAAAAQRLTGLPPAFELSITNVDKPALIPEEIQRRRQQFTWRARVWLTRAPTFAEKATLFPGTTFVVGADTAARIIARCYYDESEMAMKQALDHIRGQGCRFLVAGRVDGDRRFVDLAQVGVPAAFQELFTAIPETDFRLDISSTELRRVP
jgi:hypothetical protein